ncbi:YciI family protein [Polluticaenibacter yanchengensis]|uniref:YCII-related domain-containing protein n=1 Tax=Polluticaenibacter yanchengensis TaxID=3014562 RepID=A0ABT4UP49_9BACT|nr:hypothetical protein [Chitinophagaceae bacterium LY-5]
MTKYLIAAIIILIVHHSFAQGNVLNQLKGSWINNNTAKQFDLLGPTHIKGVTYSNKNNNVFITEYFEIKKVGNIWKYQSTVIDSNKTIIINMDGKVSANSISFERNGPTGYYKYSCTVDNDSLKICQSESRKKGNIITYHKVAERAKKLNNNANPNYDEALAKKLGSDDYGMKSYFWVILKSGTYTGNDTALRKESFKQHLVNINRLVDEGKMIVAGPLAKNENNYRGIFVFQDIKNKEQLIEMLNSDLAIKNKFLDYEIYTWFGSAALPLYLPESDKIWKIKP